MSDFTQNPTAVEQKMVSRGGSHGGRPGAFSILGWILGATSILNLVQDIGRLAVFGKLKVWLDAYVLLVRQVGSFLFGWIHYYWFGVSEAEQHVLVIACIFTGAVARAEYQLEMEKDPEGDRFAILFGVTVLALTAWFLFPLLLTIALPDYWGSAASSGLLLLLAALWLTNSESDKRMASGRSVLRELIGVVGVFLVLVALNYSVFRTDGG